jgi:hypothetical protein
MKKCECENANCDHENGCNRTPEQTLNTVYGKFHMCSICAWRFPDIYLKADSGDAIRTPYTPGVRP